MPFSPSVDTLYTMLQDQQRRLRSLETSPFLQNSSIKNGALQVLNSAGELVMSIGENTDGTASLEVYDNSGNLRLQLGQLDSGDYGLAIAPSGGGVTQEVTPTVIQTVTALQAVTSTSYAANGGPTLTAVIGASGNALVAISAEIALTVATGQTGYACMFVDGAQFPMNDLLVVSSTDAEITASASSTREVTGLTPGSHTFAFNSKVSGGTVNFTSCTLAVTPL